MKRLLSLWLMLGLLIPGTAFAVMIADLPHLTTVATGDLIICEDVSEAVVANKTKYITWGELVGAPGAIGGTTPAAGAFTTVGVGVTPPTYPVHLVLEATDETGIYIDGTTNDYTGAATGIAQIIQRDVNRGTGAINNYAGWQSYLNLKHTNATIAGDYFSYGNITRIHNDGAGLTITDGTDRQYWEVGAHNTVKEEGIYDTDGAGKFSTRFVGTYSWVWADPYIVRDTGTGSPVNVFSASGLDIKVEHGPTLDGTATGTFNSYGIYVDEVTGDAAGTSKAYGIYINSVSGADSNWGIYDASGADWYTSGNISATTLAATGAITGEISITLDTGATVTLAATDCRGHARFNNDADVIDYTLPAAEAGLIILFYDIGGGVITIDPFDGTDTIYLNGTSVGAGDAIDSPGSVGDFIALMALDATRWVTVGQSGTWIDGGAD